MFPSFQVGRVFGFPIRIHLSFIAFLGMGLLFMGGMPAVLVLLMVAGSVLVHELGHAVLARRLGVGVREIGLHFFGGAARMTSLPRHPGDEIAIAGAGPAVSFVLAGLGHGLALVTGWRLLSAFGWINLVLAVFNLFPAFPSDGGRILRALLARRRGFVRATDLAVMVSRVVCCVLIAGGLLAGSFRLVLVAIVLWTFGTRERALARMSGDADRWPGATPGQAAVAYIPPASVGDDAGPYLQRGRVIVRWR